MRRAEPWKRLLPMECHVTTPVWVLVLSVLLALAFAATALGKALDIVGFALILHDYRLFPDASLMPLALGVVGLECAIAVGLLRSSTRAMAAGAAMLLAAGNGLVLAVTLWRGIALDNCGCFGVFLARPLMVYSPLEDLLLIFLVWLVRQEALR